MKNTLFLLLLGLCSCAGTSEKDLTGTWIEQVPNNANYIQGFTLEENGQAESVGMRTLLYKKWELNDGRLILSGESIGNGQTLQFCDTMNIVRSCADTLVVERRDKRIVYVKDKNTPETVNDIPARKAYEGFSWKKLSGIGLNLWVQESESIRLIADSSLPGIVMVRKNDTIPHGLIRIFDLPNKDINDVIKVLEKTENWDKEQTGKFEEVKSERDKVRRFILVPDGDYASKIEMLMKSEPVPAPCNGWGVGNSGRRYFEIHDSHPDKAIFVEIGQEAPLFDENTIVFSDMKHLSCDEKYSKDELYTLKGSLTIGHEVRSFRPENDKNEYWIVDKTGILNDFYDKATKGNKKGDPLQVTLKVEYNGKWNDGFAADYAGVFFVRQIIDRIK